MRSRWVYNQQGELIYAEERGIVTLDRRDFGEQGPLVIGELPSYQSPIDGRWIDGRVARREDFKRNNSRPWEGLDQEKKEAARQEQYREQKSDASLHRSVSESFYQLSPEKRNILTGRAK